MDTGSKSGGLFQGESRGEQRGIVKEPDKILDGLVTLVSICLLAKSNNDRVLGVDFHGLLGGHVGGLGGITESLSLHDTFHVGGPSVFSSDETARRVSKTVGNNNLLNLVIKNLLHELGETLNLALGLFESGLLVFILSDVKSLLGSRKKLLAFEFLKLLDGILVDGVNHVNNFVSLLLESLKERRGLDGTLGFSSNVVDSRLVISHAVDVVIERSHFLSRLGGVVTQELGNLGTVGGVFVDSELEVLGKGFVELLVGIFVLGHIVEHLETLLDKVLLDNTKDLVLLESFTRNVEGKILRVDNSLNELQPFRHDVLAVVHDEDTSDVKLDVVVLLLVTTLEHIERSTLGGEEDSLELKLTLDREVLDSGMFLPIVGDGLVERNVLVLGNLVGLSHPDRLHVVQVFPFVADLLDLLGLLFLLGFVFVDLLDLGLVAITFLFVLFFVIGDLLLGGLFGVKLDRESNELRVLLDEILDSLLLKIFAHVLLEVENDTGSTTKRGIVDLGDNERTSGFGAPHVAFVAVVLGNNLDLIGNKVGRVETDTELSDHANVGSSRKGLHESLGSRLGDGSKVIDEIGLGHTNTGILNG